MSISILTNIDKINVLISAKTTIDWLFADSEQCILGTLLTSAGLIPNLQTGLVVVDCETEGRSHLKTLDTGQVRFRR